MINFFEATLQNGLKIIVHEDHSTPMALVNVMYNVGARDELPSKTGFAHLFEHLMFGGSKNVESYDQPLQKVGGDNNAFTNNDITNYYVSLPADNIETAFWLESDRMLQLSFDPVVLETQRKVVIEEFKQRYLNQPYGNVWHKLRPLAFQKHPYQWPTIGKKISHIEDATMEDVKSFFYTHYAPNNAILTVAGNVRKKQVMELAEKWFGDIPTREIEERNLPQEPMQTEYRELKVEADVPADALYLAYKMPERVHKDYQATDLLSDIIGRGKSSRLYHRLLKEEKLFSSINAYVTGSFDPGLLIITGKLTDGITIEKGQEAIESILNQVAENGISDDELMKVKNQAISTISFAEIELMNRALGLSIGSLLGNINMINEERSKIEAINKEDIKQQARNILQRSKCTSLHYRRSNGN